MSGSRGKGPLLTALSNSVDAGRIFRDVAFENEHVRVVDMHYGPHEKSVMHQHPAGVAVYITPGHFRFTDENGKVIEADAKAGEARWFPAFKHKVENLSDKPFDGVYVEIKK